jgi:hypothetical protein
MLYPVERPESWSTRHVHALRRGVDALIQRAFLSELARILLLLSAVRVVGAEEAGWAFSGLDPQMSELGEHGEHGELHYTGHERTHAHPVDFECQRICVILRELRGSGGCGSR